MSVTAYASGPSAHPQKELIKVARRAYRALPAEEQPTSSNALELMRRFFSESREQTLQHPSQRALKSLGALVDAVMEGVPVAYERLCSLPNPTTPQAKRVYEKGRNIMEKTFDRWSIVVLVGGYFNKNAQGLERNFETIPIPFVQAELGNFRAAIEMVSAFEQLRQMLLSLVEFPSEVSRDAELFNRIQTLDRLWWEVMRGTRERFLMQMGMGTGTGSFQEMLAIGMRIAAELFPQGGAAAVTESQRGDQMRATSIINQLITAMTQRVTEGFLADRITEEAIQSVDSGLLHYMLAAAYVDLLVGPSPLEEFETERVFTDLFSSNRADVLALRRSLKTLQNNPEAWARLHERMLRQMREYDQAHEALPESQTAEEQRSDALFRQLMAMVTASSRASHTPSRHFAEVLRTVAANLETLKAQKN